MSLTKLSNDKVKLVIDVFCDIQILTSNTNYHSLFHSFDKNFKIISQGDPQRYFKIRQAIFKITRTAIIDPGSLHI